MQVILGSLIHDAKEARGTVIIVDVFRAFTTAAVAFDRGATMITMVADVDQARTLHGRGVGDVLMGEVAGSPPEGFDLGNSPYEASQFDFTDKTVIQSTRAGVVGVAAASRADEIFLGSLVVAQATVDAIWTKDPALVTVVAMGDEGVVRADEDEHCAMFLRNLLEGRPARRLLRGKVNQGRRLYPPVLRLQPASVSSPRPGNGLGSRPISIRDESG